MPTRHFEARIEYDMKVLREGHDRWKWDKKCSGNAVISFFLPKRLQEAASGSTNTAGIQDVYISNIEARNVFGQEGSLIQGSERDRMVYHA